MLYIGILCLNVKPVLEHVVISNWFWAKNYCQLYVRDHNIDRLLDFTQVSKTEQIM